MTGPICDGDLIAVYTWNGHVAVFHNGALLSERELKGDERARFVASWLDVARQNGASFRFDDFGSRERALAESALDLARANWTAAHLDGKTVDGPASEPEALARFREATVAAYGRRQRSKTRIA